MKTTTISFMAALLVFAGFCAFAGIEASGAPEPRSELREVATPHPAYVQDYEPIGDALQDPQTAHLAVYVLGVMNDWSQTSLPHADYADVAYDIAAASLKRPSTAPWQDAVLLAAIAYKESGFAEFVDSGLCNSWDWQHTDEGKRVTRIGGTCDGTLASSVFQIHADLTLDGERVSATDLRQDRRYAAWVAIRIARMDPSLGAYTGGNMIKAEARLEFARRAIERHPFSP